MIKGEKIQLRALKQSDFEKTIVWRNQPELTKLVLSHPFPITEALELDWYHSILNSKDNKSVYFGIDTIQGNLIGLVFLNNINWIHRTCWFHILIGDSSAQGKGYGKETMQLISNYAFNTLNLNKISLEVATYNLAAIKLYESTGFIKEGLLKQHYFVDGQFIDSIIMSKFKENAQ
ncbi:MAG: GNAT family N-acetyltransferase [Bacteroidales bacterium]|nr:GNAT family N-acetyltransferase [Bacteroidales bacterium]